MLVPSKFQLSSFWVILSIVVYSYCYNDSRVGFNYGNTSIEYNLESAGGHSNGLELSSIVDFNRDLDGILPDLSTAPSLEASERLPTLTDVEFSDDEDFPGVLNTLDTASPFEIPDASDILHWLSDIGLSYNHSGYDPSPSSSCPLPSLRYRSYPTQIDGVDLPSSVEGVPTHREVPRNSVPSDRDFHHQPASSTLNNELPRNPLQEERQDLPDLWILHQRTRAQLQPKPDSQPRWRFWTADDEPPQESSREWPILGTVATAAATLAFVNDAEKRRKRARSAGSDEETPPRMKLWEFQAPRLVFPPPPPSYSESVCSLDYHPLVSEYLKKLGDVDIFRERLEWHTEEKDALEREREERKRVNLVLAVADQEWLDGFSDSESKLKNQLKKAEDETEELRKECYSRGLVDEEGEPLEFKESERGASGADVVDADGELHDFVRFPLLLPIPFFQPPNHNVQRYILEQQAFGNDVNSWDSEDELASNPNLSTTLAWESSLSIATNLPVEHKHNEQHQNTAPQRKPALIPSQVEYFGDHDILLQPEITPTSQEQLTTDEGGIYSGLYSDEDNCIEVEKKQKLTSLDRSHEEVDCPDRFPDQGRCSVGLAEFTSLPGDIQQRIASFLAVEDIVHLSLACRQLRVCFKPTLLSISDLKKARKAAELQDHWTTRATLALPIDEEELFQTMGTRIVETSFDSYVSPPSAIMEPLETMDNWLLSFKDLEFNSGDENARKSGPVLSLSREAAHGMIPATRSYCKPQVSHELSYAPNHLTIMVSEEVNREGLPDDEEESSGDEVMDLDKEEDTEDSAQIDNTSKFGINVNGRSVSTQGDEKNSFDFPTPSMTEGSTTIKYSPDSKPSPSTPGSLISPKARSHHCPQCTYSCRRMCDLRKHSKYHTKDFQCSIPDCRRSFSRKQDLVRHEKGPHQNGRVEHYCPHAECQAKNQKPFSRKDNLMKHLRNKHSQNKIENDEHEEQGEHTEGEEREVERQNEEGKGEQDHSPGSDA